MWQVVDEHTAWWCTRIDRASREAPNEVLRQSIYSWCKNVWRRQNWQKHHCCTLKGKNTKTLISVFFIVSKTEVISLWNSVSVSPVEVIPKLSVRRQSETVFWVVPNCSTLGANYINSRCTLNIERFFYYFNFSLRKKWLKGYSTKNRKKHVFTFYVDHDHATYIQGSKCTLGRNWRCHPLGTISKTVSVTQK